MECIIIQLKARRICDPVECDLPVCIAINYNTIRDHLIKGVLCNPAQLEDSFTSRKHIGTRRPVFDWRLNRLVALVLAREIHAT